MDPLTLQLLLAGVQTGAGVAGAVYKSPQEKADAEEAQRLRRELEAGALGYSSADFTKDIGAQLAGTKTIRDEATARAAGMRGTALGSGSGQALLEAQVSQEKTADMVADAAARAGGRSLQKAAQQEQRLYGLEAQQAQSQQDAFTGIMQGVAQGAAGFSEMSQAKQLVQSQKISGEELEAFAGMTGLDAKAAKGLFKTMQSDPTLGAELLQLLTAQATAKAEA